MTQPETSRIVPYVALLRPRQWIKNFFVFAPLIFAKELFDPGSFTITLRAFVAFCLTASATYTINDITDVDADRAHPAKRGRPLAAGLLTTPQALGALCALLLLDVVLLLGMNARFIVTVAFYFLMNLAYSFKLKEVVLLDVFIIAAGFMLRILGGAYAIGVEVSTWLVLCSLFISLFLGFAKRRGELIQTQTSGGTAERKVLMLYRVDFIDQMLTIAAAGTVISYALYTVAERTVEVFRTDKMIYTTIFVLYGVFRYLYLIHTSSATENPTKAVVTDLPILATGVLWIITCIGVIYFLGNTALVAH